MINACFGGGLKKIENHAGCSHILDNGMNVNSFHNFAIDTLGSGLWTAAASSDGVIEIIRHTKHRIYAQMYHPERCDPSENMIYNSCGIILMLNKIITIARNAGAEILNIYENGKFETRIKEDASPLTKADIASNEIIINGLKQISDYPILSEKNSVEYDTRKCWKNFWMVDPLDGTKDFIAKNGQFTVNIALIDADKPVLGVIFIPALNEMYWSEAGKNAYKNGVKIYNSREDSELAAADSVFHSSKEIAAFLEKNAITRIKRFGSSIKFCRLAEGKIDIYPRFNGTKEWDTAAGLVILCEAGCKIIDLKTKQELKYSKPDIRNNFFYSNAK
jgi:3'(2'), 5'-bisphosphate nucleotidase